MVATVEICEDNGSGPTTTHNVSNVNFGSTDAPNLTPASYPITVGNNSFHKCLRIHWTSGTANKLSNFRFWKSAGACVTGEGINWKCSQTYTQPSASALSGTSACPVADPGSQNVSVGGSMSGNLTSVGYTDYIMLQTATTGSTPPGDANQKTFVFQYDEE